LSFQKDVRAVSNHTRVIACDVAGVGVLENDSLVRSHALGGNHRGYDGRAAAGFPDPRLEVPRHAEVVPHLQRLQRFIVDPHCVVVGVIVRQIGTGYDQRVAAACVAATMDQLCQSHTQRAAVFVTLVSHDDGYKFEITQHVLQPRQFHLERMFGAFFSGSMSLAGEFNGWVHLHELLGKRFVYPDSSERRCIGVAVVDGSEIKGHIVRRRNHHHARKLAPLQRCICIGSDRAGKLITGVRCNHGENRTVDRRQRRMRQHVIHHRRKRLWVGWIKAAGDTGLSYVLRRSSTHVLPSHHRQESDEQSRQPIDFRTNLDLHAKLLSHSHACQTPGIGC